MPARSTRVKFQNLRDVIAAAEYGSFRKAANALHIKQSTLSRSVREVEDIIGVRLFERVAGGVRATSAGLSLLKTARSILEQVDSLLMTAYTDSRGETGRLAIGFHTSLSAGNLRATLLNYAQRFPQIEIGMTETSRTRLITALRNGVIDIAIVTGETPLLDSKAMPLWSERIVVAMPKDHRLTSNGTIFWTDLRGETLLMARHDPGPEIQDLLAAKFSSPEDRPKIVHHDVSRGNIKSVVSAGFGVSLMTESCIDANFAGLVYREAGEGTEQIRIGYSAHWREENDNPALASFLNLLRELYPSIAA